MEIVLLGTGNTASVLGRKIKSRGHTIVQVFGREEIKAKKLADQLDAYVITSMDALFPDADIYIIAITDTAVPAVAANWRLKDKLVVHTAGSVSKNVFLGTAHSYGVFYPLQSLKKELTYLPEIPVLLDASDDKTLSTLKKFALTISDTVLEAGDEQRKKLHLAAVISNNFVNHLFAVTQDYCERENMDFRVLLPLIQETVSRLKEIPAYKSQTGPAVRGDEVTMTAHRELLNAYPQLKKIYELLSDSITLTHQAYLRD
jgi:predicted short-subunit dehydrogenase-like oxidoreductase (DUF2520 family)